VEISQVLDYRKNSECFLLRFLCHKSWLIDGGEQLVPYAPPITESIGPFAYLVVHQALLIQRRLRHSSEMDWSDEVWRRVGS
jgi:hypothetical protein